MDWLVWGGPGTKLERRPWPEWPEEAAQRLYRRLLRDGYSMTGIWGYMDGPILWWVCRFEHPTKRKEIRPLMREGREYKPGKPEFVNGAPLLNLNLLRWQPEETVWVVEGEKAADCMEFVCGRLATTWPGGANAILKADWRALAGRRAILWPDNDQAGLEAMASILPVLRAQGTQFVQVDVETLGLQRHGDVVDWVQAVCGGQETDWETRLELALRKLPLLV